MRLDSSHTDSLSSHHIPHPTISHRILMFRPLQRLILSLYVYACLKAVLLSSPNHGQREVRDFDLNQIAMPDEETEHESEGHHDSITQSIHCDHNALCSHWPTFTQAEKTKVYWERYKKKTVSSLIGLPLCKAIVLIFHLLPLGP